MSANRCRLAEVARSTRRFFFPRRLDVPDHVWETLERVYPTVDWGRVEFYEGWPHLLRGRGFRAITLPNPHSVHRINVYFTSDAWRPNTAGGLSTIVHEGYHVLQIQETWRGYGIGLVRPFLAAYLGNWAVNGFRYVDHPMEEEAYRVAGRRTSRYERYLRRADQPNVAKERPLPDFQETEPERTFWQRVRFFESVRPHDASRRVPHAAAAGLSAFASLLWVTGWTAVLIVLWLLWLTVEGIGLLAAGSTSLLAWVGCGCREQDGIIHV